MKKVSFLLDNLRIKDVDFKGYTANAAKGSIVCNGTLIFYGARGLVTIWLRTPCSKLATLRSRCHLLGTRMFFFYLSLNHMSIKCV